MDFNKLNPEIGSYCRKLGEYVQTKWKFPKKGILNEWVSAGWGSRWQCWNRCVNVIMQMPYIISSEVKTQICNGSIHALAAAGGGGSDGTMLPFWYHHDLLQILLTKNTNCKQFQWGEKRAATQKWLHISVGKLWKQKRINKSRKKPYHQRADYIQATQYCSNDIGKAEVGKGCYVLQKVLIKQKESWVKIPK